MNEEKKGFEHPKILFQIPTWIEGCDDCQLWFESWPEAVQRCGFSPFSDVEDIPVEHRLEGIVGVKPVCVQLKDLAKYVEGLLAEWKKITGGDEK